jgi:hypothetical protein
LRRVHRLPRIRPLAHLGLNRRRSVIVERENDEEIGVQDDAQALRA